jgi:hypothetical protein
MATLLYPGFNTNSPSRLHVSIASSSEERAYTPGQSSRDPPPPWDFTIVSSPKAASSQFLPLNRTTGWIERVSTKQEPLWHKNKLHDTPSFEFWMMAWYTFINHTSPHQPLGVPLGPHRELRVLARTPSSRNLVLEYLHKATPVVYAKLALIFWEGKGFSLRSKIWCIAVKRPKITSFDSQISFEPILSNNERSCFHKGQTLS